MTSLRTALALALVALLAACADGTATTGTTALSEPQVRAFVEKVEAATGTDADVEVTAAALADDARITWKGVETGTATKAEYLEDLAAGEIEDEAYSYKVGAVRVAADGQSATASVAMKSTFQYDGQRVEDIADQVYTIELRDGEPKVVSIESTTTSLTVDGNKQL